MNSIAIIGGGIAGLAAAHRLTRLVPDASITLIEAEDRLGGKIVTDRAAGFVIEGGPDTFLSLKPRGLGLCRELGLETRLHGTNETIRRTYVMRGGRLYELPEGLTGLIPSRFGPMAKTGLISPLGKLRMGLDYLIPPRAANGDESLASFVERRLGRELYDRLIEPLMSGIYAGDGEQLSLAATFPQLRQTELEHGGLIRGMLAAKKTTPAPKPGAKKWAAFLTPTTGLAEIVEALAQRLGAVDVRLGTRVACVESMPPGFAVRLERGESITADSIIFATPSFATADLIADLDSRLATALRGIPYVSTATVSAAYPLADIPRPLDGYGYIIPRTENRAILACTWTSTKFPHRAPEGYGLIRAFVGRAGQEDVVNGSDDDLLALVRDELRRTLGITAAPMLSRVFRWPKAMPQYTLGHTSRLALIDERLASHPGLFAAGNAYRGIGIPDCIASGEQAAEGAVKTLSEIIPA
ncbi:MAG: protoporphyrinogen oxidase [Chloroflexi bacterium]|nr:protoporphyrinogen oxidase [Chloroflexota bacterium]